MSRKSTMNDQIRVGANIAIAEINKDPGRTAGNWIVVVHESAGHAFDTAKAIGTPSSESGWMTALVSGPAGPPTDAIQAAVAADGESGMFELNADDRPHIRFKPYTVVTGFSRYGRRNHCCSS